MSYKVETGIVIPPRRAANMKYPFDRMRVDDSFFIPASEVCETPEDIDLCSRLLGGAYHSYGRRHKMKYVQRQCFEGKIHGFRIWRVE